MADRLNAGRTKKKGTSGRDRFEDLPEHVLELMLSFLPSREAVQTCVLAKRWRDIWKSVPSLRIYNDEFETDEGFNCFVDSLIELRDQTVPLHVCEINLNHDPLEVVAACQDILQYAVSCQAQVLRVEHFPDYYDWLKLSNNSFISDHLVWLELCHIESDLEHFLDLWRCQTLEVLDIDNCRVNLGGVFPKSLRHLRIRGSEFYPDDRRTRISAPGLVTCEIADCFEWTPLLESLPSVVMSSIKIGLDECCFEDDCSVLLECLSGSTNLKLSCHPSSMIFSNDLKWCPEFGKLRTLLLHHWWVADNFSGLLYFLQHSPILEKLILELVCVENVGIKIVESCDPREKFLVSKRLKVVKINGLSNLKMIHILPIVKLLSTHGVPPEKINFQNISWRQMFERKKHILTSMFSD